MLIGTIEEQLKLEEEQQAKRIDSYIREINEAIVTGRLDQTQEGIMLTKLGYIPLLKTIEEYIKSPAMGSTKKNKDFLLLLCDDARVLALLTLSTMISVAGVPNMSLHSASKRLASVLKKTYLFTRLKKDNPKLHSYLGREFKRASVARREELVEKHIKDLINLDFAGADNALAVRVGSILIDLLVKSGANIVEVYRDMGSTLSNRKYLIRFTPEAQEILINATDLTKIIAKTTMFPMVVPPKDWESMYKGGYLKHKVQFVKANNSIHKRYLQGQDLSKVFTTINKLQKTSWRINSRVYDVLQYVFTNNLIDPKTEKILPRCYGSVPSAKLYIPEEVIGTLDYSLEAKYGEKIFNQLIHQYEKKKNNLQIDLDAEASRRLNFVLALNVAKKMKEYKEFWYVYNVDYRGRVYPHNEFLNPQSKTYIKAMLEFSQGRKLNEVGVKWLKIHIANCYGLDKAEFKERIEYVDTNESIILAIANNPLDNLSSWVYTDAPYEYLAGCMAYKDHLDGKEVHLPIQLDATCSGLQFYSGLLLDREGAKAVNVIGQTREDVYQDVADRVNSKLEAGEYIKVVEFKDSEGVERSQFTIKEADSLKGKVSRSVCKRNVMTVPYSVTLRGMADQNYDYMKKCELEGKVFWKGDPWIVNRLITDLNYTCIYEVVKGAKLGQEYLKEVAGNLEEVATWFTPLFNFPVMQPTFRRKATTVRTPFGRLNIIQHIDGVNRQKQMNSVAANFIHSMDSTLLMYCADNMSTDIGVIHDCFLVHPNEGDEIRYHYKEGFIKIMECNPLKMFGDKLDTEHKVEVPCVGTLDLTEVRDSEYIIS